MALTLLSPKTSSVSKGNMPKMKAIGHVCSKLAHVIYSCLKNGKSYDPRLHALACGIPWEEGFDRRPTSLAPSEHEAQEQEVARLHGTRPEHLEEPLTLEQCLEYAVGGLAESPPPPSRSKRSRSGTLSAMAALYTPRTSDDLGLYAHAWEGKLYCARRIALNFVRGKLMVG